MTKLQRAPAVNMAWTYSGQNLTAATRNLDRRTFGRNSGYWCGMARHWIKWCQDRDITEVHLNLPWGDAKYFVPGFPSHIPFQFFQRKEAREGLFRPNFFPPPDEILVHPPMPWLAEVPGYQRAMRDFRANGIFINAYIGNANQVPDGPDRFDRWLEEAQPILDVCNEINFDALFSFPLGGYQEQIRLYTEALGVHFRSEPFPLKAEPWTITNRWYCREKFYRENRVNGDKWSDIIPTDLRRGLTTPNLDYPNETLQEAALRIEGDGHRVLVRWTRWDNEGLDY